MVPRALFRFVRAFLAVLALLGGTPVMGIGGPQASATSWRIDLAPAPAIRGDFSSDITDGAINPFDDDDSPDDLIVWLVAVTAYRNATFKPRVLHADERAGPTHRPCAAQPRAPPIG